MEFLIAILLISLLINVCVVIALLQAEEKLKKSKKIRDEFDLLECDYLDLQNRHSKRIKEYNELVNNRNALLELYYDAVDQNTKLKKKIEFGEFSNNSFTDVELKRIAFSVHPDKNGGKTTELWRKVQGMIKK